MFCTRFYLKVCIILSFSSSFAKSQFYDQNATLVPYPYQSALGISPGQGFGVPGQQNVGFQPVAASFPYSYAGNILIPTQTPNATQNFNNYYAMLAQQGRPAYQYPLGYPQPGYHQPAFGYPPLGGGYPLHGYGYPQPYQPSGGYEYYYSRTGYPYPGINAAYPQAGQGTGQQSYGRIADPYPNIKTEILDVSPEYQRQALGWPSQDTSVGSSNSGDSAVGGTNQESQNIQPRYNVKTDSQTSNYTSIPSNLSKPIVSTKRFTTSIRRNFVYDSSKPGENKAINLHFINGEPVTTTQLPTTTENEDVEDSGITIKGRRYMDVPSSCPKGTLLSHNGKCIEPFVFANLAVPRNETVEVTTQAPE